MIKTKKNCEKCGTEFIDNTYNQNKKFCSDKCKQQSDNKYRVAWAKKNPESVENGRLKRRFGISLDEYNDIFSKQEGRCAICGRHQSEFDIAFDVDHDHKTGKVRGLLCRYCNTSLGHFKDDTSILQKAIDYLKRK